MTAPGLGSAEYGRPLTSARPDVAGTRPVIIRIVVVLPAPLGPRKPVTVPDSSSNDTSSTTVRSPYFLVRPLTVIISASSTGISGSGENVRCPGGAVASADRPNPGRRTSRRRQPKVDPRRRPSGDGAVINPRLRSRYGHP